MKTKLALILILIIGLSAPISTQAEITPSYILVKHSNSTPIKTSMIETNITTLEVATSDVLTTATGLKSIDIPNPSDTIQFELTAQYDSSYAVSATSYKTITSLDIYNEDTGEKATYTRVEKPEERDLFREDLFAYKINLSKNTRYLLVFNYTTALLAQTDRVNEKFEIIDYVEHTSAMAKEDLYCWSASYTDNTKVTVKNNGQVYVNLAKYAPEIVSLSSISFDYNRTGKPIDKGDIIIVRKDLAKKLIVANKLLMKKGYRICVYDGYRSERDTQVLFDYTLRDFKLPKSKRSYPTMTRKMIPWYVVNPAHGPAAHGRGAAVDLTIVDMKTGKLLNMPTRINDMTKKAWIRPMLKSKQYAYLLSALKKAGIHPYEREWYHNTYDINKKAKNPSAGLRMQFYEVISNNEG